MESNFISYVPAIIGISSIGIFVFLNANNAKNRVFALFSLFIALWLMGLLGSDLSHNVTISLWFLRVALFCASFGYVSLYYFSLMFPYVSKTSVTRQIIYSIPLFLAAILSLTPLVVPSVKINSYIAEPQNTGILYSVTDIVSELYVLAAAITFAYKLRHSDAQQKKQIKFVLIGIFIAFIVNVFTGDILTIFNINTQYIDFGGFSLLALSIFIAYAMIRHGFLDIRLLVARTFAYTLTLGTIAGVYGLILFGLLAHLSSFSGVSTGQKLLYIALAVVLSFTFQPIKRFFDKQSNRLFYQDGYDTQEFLNTFNKVLVSSYELNALLGSSASTIQQNLKSTYATFVIPQPSPQPSRIIGTSGYQDLGGSDKEIVREELKMIYDQVVIVESLPETYSKLRSTLSDDGISVIARLYSGTNQRDVAGYLILGPKQSGNLYSSGDVKVIEIIANELVIAIQNALRFEEIANFNVTLQARIDDATKKLRNANDKLKELDETKDDFISMASHQLRTPLTSIKGYISMVMEQDAGSINDTQRDMLGQAFFSSQRMVYLISDLLNVSRLKSGKFIIDATKVNLSTMVQQELEQLRETAASRKLTLQYDKPEEFPDLMFDETKTRQVIMNFVDNAIYYTPAGGHIIVKLINNPTTIELRVEDNGIGVPKTEQPNLFTKFYRAGNARKARPDGTGLGLFMAKKVIIAQGGSTLFESEEGKGSTFGFIFSKAAVAPKVETAQEDAALAKV